MHAQCVYRLAWPDSLLGADQCNSSGFYPNLQEIGGPDTAALTAVANSIGQVCGAAVSPIAFLLHRRTGSWAPVFVASSGLLVVSGVVYRALISLRSGRQILVRDQQLRVLCVDGQPNLRH